MQLTMEITRPSKFGGAVVTLEDDRVIEITNNDDFKVTYLFEKDGIKVYRFEDGLIYHYFTTRGETITTQESGESYKQENITSN